MSSPLYIAVDLGAGSGRVFLSGDEPGELLLEEIHRFVYPPRKVDGHLRWDFSSIFGQVKIGLKMAGERARVHARPVMSIGVDSWAVDYGLLGKDGRLIRDPVCYRDPRTDGIMEQVFQRVPRGQIFERTGIQFLPFNTLFQLYSERDGIGEAQRLLLLPDLIHFQLTGQVNAEYTNATTTQMVNAGTGQWDGDLLNHLGLPRHLLPDLVPAGTDLGPLKDDVARQLQLNGVRVVAPATHDTASAVAGAPLREGSAYISSGTWSLVGIERTEPIISRDSARLNFTNEGGAFGTVRFLKNVMGLWILESCRKEWAGRGLETDHNSLLKAVNDLPGIGPLIFPDDERFLNPPSMCEAIAEQLRLTGQWVPEDPAGFSKAILDSLAMRFASVLRNIVSISGNEIEEVIVVGGGGRNRYLNQMTANASGLRVRVGSPETTVIGNVLVQAIAAGRFGSLTEARSHVDANIPIEDFLPRQCAEIDEARRKYEEIEVRYTG